MNVSRENFPTHINGEEVIGIVQGRKASLRSASFQGMIDQNEMLYNNDESRYHLGLLSSFGMQGRESYPMITKMLERGSQLKVKGFGGEFTYDKPFYDPKEGMKTVASTVAEAGDFPGIDESKFDIILSEKCYVGEILGTDLYGDEEQLYVHGCEDSELNGQGWRTTVTLASGVSSYHYNPALLEAGITYYKINTAYGEFSQGFAGVDVPNGHPTGVLRARFRLGSIRGVEGNVTAYADSVGANGFATANGGDRDSQMGMLALRQKYGADADADTVIFGQKGADNIPNVRATSLMEFLVEKTLMKRTATSHMWQRQGEIKGNNGTLYLNEGVWHQLRRGKIIKVPKIYGITRSHITEAVEYVYRNSPNIPWEERELVFETATLGQDNLLLLFQNEVQSQLGALQNAWANGLVNTLFGDRGVLSENLRSQGLVTGDNLNELQLTTLLRFTTVSLIGIAGKVTFKFNEALDFLSGNPTEFRGQGLPKGKDWTSHSLIIWDVRDQQYSNNMKNIDGAETMDGESKIKDNLYMVTPEDGMMFKGMENGRWNKGITSNIISSSRFLGQNFWAFNASAMWVPYPENVVMIELAEGARRGGLSPYSYQ